MKYAVCVGLRAVAASVSTAKEKTNVLRSGDVSDEDRGEAVALIPWLSSMLRNGEIVSVRKGLYIRSYEFGGTVEPVEMANVVYGLSYVSLEYTLSRLLPLGACRVGVEITRLRNASS